MDAETFVRSKAVLAISNSDVEQLKSLLDGGVSPDLIVKPDTAERMLHTAIFAVRRATQLPAACPPAPSIAAAWLQCARLIRVRTTPGRSRLRGIAAEPWRTDRRRGAQPLPHGVRPRCSRCVRRAARVASALGWADIWRRQR